MNAFIIIICTLCAYSREKDDDIYEYIVYIYCDLIYISCIYTLLKEKKKRRKKHHDGERESEMKNNMNKMCLCM